MGNNTAYLAGERSEVPVLRLSYIGPPDFDDAKRYVFDVYDALWFKASADWKQVTPGASATEPAAPPDGYLYTNTTTGFTYIYTNDAWAAITDTAVPTFVPDAAGDPGVAGLVPASAAGDAVAKKVLLATGAWAVNAPDFTDVVIDNAQEVASNANVAAVVAALTTMGIFTAPA